MIHKKLKTCIQLVILVKLMGKKAVMGALTLYLDFINLFIMLLKTFWSEKITLFLKFFPVCIF